MEQSSRARKPGGIAFLILLALSPVLLNCPPKRADDSAELAIIGLLIATGALRASNVNRPAGTPLPEGSLNSSETEFVSFGSCKNSKGCFDFVEKSPDPTGVCASIQGNYSTLSCQN